MKITNEKWEQKMGHGVKLYREHCLYYFMKLFLEKPSDV